jgi:hypothetical protein
LEWLGKHKKLYPSLAEFYFPKAVAAKRNPKQPGLFTVVADSCQGDVEDNSAVVYDADKELAAQRAIEERVAKQRRARKEREREEKRQRQQQWLEQERIDYRAVAWEPDWYGSREPVDAVARAADAAFRAYATPERIAETRTIHQISIDRGLRDSWEAIRHAGQSCSCRDCRLAVHVAELVIQEQRDAAMVAQTAYDYSVMEAVRHLSTAAEAAAEPEHRESGAGERAT